MFDGCILLDAMKTRGFLDPLFISLHQWSEGLHSWKGLYQVTDRISAKQTRREAIACDMCVSRHVAVADVGNFKNVNYSVAKQINVLFSFNNQFFHCHFGNRLRE